MIEANFLDIRTIKELIDYAAKQYKNITFVKYNHADQIVKKTFSEVRDEIRLFSNKCAHWKQKKIGLIGMATYEWLVAYLGMLYAGVIVVPIDMNFEAKEMKELLIQAEVEGIFADFSLKEKIEELREEISHISYLQVPEDYIVQISEVEEREVELNEEMIATIIFTSGTTGIQKGVMLTHKNLCADVKYLHDLLRKDFKIGYETLAILPTHHMFYPTAGILACLILGMSVCIEGDFRYITRAIQQYNPDIIYTVPMVVENIYNRMIRVKDKDEDSLAQVLGTKLKIVISGGAFIDNSLVEGFRERNITLLNGYGITECSPVIMLNTIEFNKLGSVGKVVENPYYELQIKDGEIMVKGDIVTKAYYKNEVATQEAFDEGWFKTGDVGRIDEDGFLFIQGRSKNIIILADGNNVSPEELEEKLKEIELIKEIIVAIVINPNPPI